VKTPSLVVALALLFCAAAWAQDAATIVGTVTDPSGAVIPNAKVTVSNPEKGFTRDLVTNTAGEYVAPKVPIGDYIVSAEVTGFQKLVRSGIALAVGQTLRVDLQLQVGQRTQEVTVAGNAPRVETETAAVSDVVTGAQISDLELNGRNFVQLALLVPGAAPANGLNATSVGVGSNTLISFNGGRYAYNNWEVDCGNNTDEGSSVTLNTFPSLDTIGEFRISTSNYGAEMGKHSGATIEVATKSGTRNFHGEAFEYLRNDHVDANDWFVNRQRWDGLNVQQDCNGDPAGPCNAPKRPLKWNEFGYNLGGPFYIPGHYNTDKSKTFFFWSQSWRRYREGTVVSANVPTPRMRQGDFSECDPLSPNYNAILVNSGCVLPRNPATEQPFPGQIVPVNPNAEALLNAFVPLPNNGVTGYLSAPSLPTDWRQEQIRVDQNISQKTRLFVRYTQDAWSQTQVPAWGWNLSLHQTGRVEMCCSESGLCWQSRAARQACVRRHASTPAGAKPRSSRPAEGSSPRGQTGYLSGGFFLGGMSLVLLGLQGIEDRRRYGPSTLCDSSRPQCHRTPGPAGYLRCRNS